MGKKKKKSSHSSRGQELPGIETASRATKRWMMLTLACVGFFVYAHTLHAPFVLDDNHKIEVNADIRIDRLSDVFSRLIYPYSENKTFDRNDPSRPVTFLTYSLNYYFGKLDPWGYRVVNLAGHIGVSLLLFALSCRLFGMTLGRENAALAFFIGLLFLTHPVNTIVALYTFNRSDILVGLFSIGSMLLFIGSSAKDSLRRAASVALFVLALGSKQSAAVLPFLLAGVDSLSPQGVSPERFRSRWRLHVPFWIVLAVYLIVRAWYFGGIGDLEAESPIDAGTYRISQIYSLVRYLQMALVPVGMSLDHMPKLYRSLMDPTLLACGGILLVGAAWVWRQAHKRSPLAGLSVFGAVWFALQIAPTSSWFPTTATFADNRLYLPLYGILLLLALGYLVLFQRAEDGRIPPGPKRILMGSLMAIHVGIFAYGAHRRGTLFNDPVALWKDVLRQYPNQPRANYSLGLLYSDKKDNATALDYFGKAVKCDPTYSEAYNNMGMIYGRLFETEKAIEYFSKSAQAGPRRVLPLGNLGRAYLNSRKYKEAIEPLQKALEINPHFVIARTLLGRVYFEMGDLPRARTEQNIALLDGPNNAEVQNNWGLLLAAENRYPEAILSYQKAIELSPTHAEAQYNLARALARTGRNEESQEWYKKACMIDPQYIFKPIGSQWGGFSGGMNQLSPEVERMIQEAMKKDH